MGTRIDSLVTEIEGDIDLQSAMGLPEPRKVRPGYQEIRAAYHIKSNATIGQLEKLAKASEDLSPTRDSLRAVKFSSKIVKQLRAKSRFSSSFQEQSGYSPYFFSVLVSVLGFFHSSLRML